MDNCLKCGKKLQHTVGRRPKEFCNTKCRNEYYAEKKKEMESIYKRVTDFCKLQNISVNQLISGYSNKFKIPEIREDYLPSHIHENGTVFNNSNSEDAKKDKKVNKSYVQERFEAKNKVR